MIDPRNFREALSRYPTGVALVAAAYEGKAVAMTVNSFASVSLDPPLILWSVDRTSDRYAAFAAAEQFSVNILRADQADLAKHFAMEAEIERADWTTNSDGIPLLNKALARLECRRYAVHQGGDHDIIVGEVLKLKADGQGDALTYFRSQYGKT